MDGLILIELNEYSPCLIPSFGSKCAASSSDDCETKNEFNKFAFSISSTTIVLLIFHTVVVWNLKRKAR